MIDVARARADTPGSADVIHLDNAGAALPPRQVVDAVIEHLELEAAVGGYRAAELKTADVEQTYRAAEKLINADLGEVALMENATRAWDMAFYGIDFSPRDRILTAQAEYASNVIAFLQVARRKEISVEIVPDDEHGQLSVDALKEMIDDRVRLIAMTHVPTQSGLVNPAAQVGKVAREAGCLYLLDACQSVGQIPLDVKELGCDFLNATGRKYLRGPRGTGFLYASRRVLQTIEPPMLDLHAATWTDDNAYEVRPDARRFETWEKNYAAVIGLGVAIDYAAEIGMHEIWERVQSLANLLRELLREIPGVKLQDPGLHKCGIVTFTLETLAPEHVARTLRDKGVNVSTSLQEYARFDLGRRGLPGVTRASVHYYNTEDEIERFTDIVRRIART